NKFEIRSNDAALCAYRIDGKFGRNTESASSRRRQIHFAATRTSGTQPGVSRSADRRRGNRRLRQEHAVVFAEALARNWRVPLAFHGVELFAAREVRDASRKAAAIADSHHVFTTARRRLCGSVRTPAHAVLVRTLPRASH